METVVDNSISLLQKSKLIDLKNKRLDSLIRIQAEIEAKGALEAGELAFISPSFVLATMPHSKQVSTEFKRKNGEHVLNMFTTSDIGLPYGSKPRLVLIFLISEAVRNQSREVILGESLTQFMQKMGLKPTGGQWGSITGLRDQMTRLFSCAIRSNRDVEVKGVEENNKIKNMYVVSKAGLAPIPRTV
jgi:Plasmid encoded RepA protein